MRRLGVINLTWENLRIAAAQIRKAFGSSADWFVFCDLYIFSGKVYHPELPHAQSLFLFPIVFGINLIHFVDGKNNIGLGRIWSFVFGFWSLIAWLSLFWGVGTKPYGGRNFLATKSVRSLRISALEWWPFKKGETGSVKGETKGANFWQGKVWTHSNCASFWQGKV